MKNKINVTDSSEMRGHDSLEEAFDASSKNTALYKGLVEKIKGACIVAYEFKNNVLILYLSNKVSVRISIEKNSTEIDFCDRKPNSDALDYPDVINLNFSNSGVYVWELRKMLNKMVGSQVGSTSISDGMIFMNLKGLGTVCFSVVFSPDIPGKKLLFFSQA